MMTEVTEPDSSAMQAIPPRARIDLQSANAYCQIDECEKTMQCHEALLER